VVNYEPALDDELLLQRADTYGNAGGQTTLAIVNSSSPLAAGKSGNVDIVAEGDSATISSSSLPFTLGKEAILVATNSTDTSGDVGRAAIWAYEKGSHLADDTTVNAARKVAFFYNASTSPGAYNDTAYALFDAAIDWALAAPAATPILVVTRSPASQNSPPTA